MNFIPDGKVTYVKKGETYFLPYGTSDLQNPTIPVKAGDQVRLEKCVFFLRRVVFRSLIQVTFNVGQDRRTNHFFARNILLIEKPVLPPTPPPPATAVKRYRGVISTMKDSFGFIERDDVLKEIFFHITEFGQNIVTSTIQLGVEVEFDIQNRHVRNIVFFCYDRYLHSSFRIRM